MAGKLRRELARIGNRLTDMLARKAERQVQQERDAVFGADMTIHPGAAPLQPKLAILVLWQPDGLLASVNLTCRHLRAQGYATLVVSNAPLTPDEVARLLPEVWLLIDRPNIGHDFGAYRDAIQYLGRRKIHLDRLLLLNDSIWFPLAEGDDLLAELEVKGGDFSGPVWMERPGRPHAAHFQSYFLMFGPRALRHPAFGQYWANYLVSSRRDSVLARGEKGVSQAMIKAGLCDPATLPDLIVSPARLLAYAKGVPEGELRKILSYAVLDATDLAPRRDALLADPEGHPAFRETALALLQSSLSRGYFAESHPFLIARACGIHLIKKRREASSTEGRLQYLRAVRAGDLPAPEASILREIEVRSI